MIETITNGELLLGGLVFGVYVGIPALKIIWGYTFSGIGERVARIEESIEAIEATLNTKGGA